MKTKLTPEQRAKRIEKYIKLGGFIFLGLIVAPIVGMAVYGLLGLLLAAGIIFTSLAFLPWAGDKLANWKLQSIKAEARKSPVETLQNEFLRRSELLVERKAKVEAFLGMVISFRTKTEAFAVRFPKESPKFQSVLLMQEQKAELKKNSWRRAKADLVRFESEIEKAQAIWEMTCAAADVDAAGGGNEEEFYAKIKTETALDAITLAMDESFAALEMDLLDNEPIEDGGHSAFLLRESAADAVPVSFREVKATVLA